MSYTFGKFQFHHSQFTKIVNAPGPEFLRGIRICAPFSVLQPELQNLQLLSQSAGDQEGNILRGKEFLVEFIVCF